MTIDEAIEIKQRTGQAFLNTDPDDIDKADRLGIEALKREMRRRSLRYGEAITLLPGETEE